MKLKISTNKSVIASLGLVIVTIIWGSTFVIIKDNLQYVNPIVLVMYRFLLASIIIGLYLVVKREKIFSNFRYGLILGLLLGTLFITQSVGLKYTSPSNSAFITGSFIIFIPIFNYFLFKQKSSFNKILAVVIAIAGLWFLTGGILK